MTFQHGIFVNRPVASAKLFFGFRLIFGSSTFSYSGSCHLFVLQSKLRLAAEQPWEVASGANARNVSSTNCESSGGAT